MTDLAEQHPTSPSALALPQFTTRIVCAYLRKNSLEASAVPDLIGLVSRTLRDVTGPGSQQIETRTPAVPIRSSVKPGHLVCLECCKKTKLLKRHLLAVHGLLPGVYKARWGLPDTYPVVAPNYSAERRQAAIDLGLGRRKPDLPTT